MILPDSSAARIGSSVVRAIASATASIRSFYVFTEAAITSALSGAINLVKTGAGILRLSTANTYTGNTTVSAGVLTIETLAALPGNATNGRVSVASGAALAVYNAITDAEITAMLATTNFAAGAFIGFDTTSGARTYPIARGNTSQGALGLLKVGTGTLTLSGANTYTGTTRVREGTLATSTADRISNSSALVVDAGAAFQLGGNEAVLNISGAGTLALGTFFLELADNSGAASFSGAITGTNTLYKTGTGTQSLAGTASVVVQLRNGTTNLIGTFAQSNPGSSVRSFQLAQSLNYNSVLNVYGTATLGAGMMLGDNGVGTSTLNILGGSLNTVGQLWFAGPTSVANIASGSLTTGGNTFYIGGGSTAGVPNSTSVLNIYGTGTMTTGSIVFGQGGAGASTTITLGNGSAGGTLICSGSFYSAGSHSLILNGGTLQNNATFALISQLVILIQDAGGTINTASGNLTIPQAITGTGALTKTGSGILILSGANTYGGGTTISAGTLQINGSLLGAIANAATLLFNRADNITFANLITGTGSLTKQGNGTLALTGVNTYSGTTTLNGGTLQLGNASAIGTSTLVFTGGTLQYATGITIDISSQIKNSSSAIRIDSNGESISFASLASSNTGGLVKSGTGTLTLLGSGNAYGGATTVAAGELTIPGTFTATNAVAINGTANPVLNISGNFTQSYTAGSVRGFQIAATGGNTGTVNISGSAVVSLGSGMMLGDNGGGSGTMNVSGGTVNPNGGTWLAGANCLLNVSGGTFSTAGIECGGGTGAGVLTVSGTGTINSGSLFLNRGSSAGVSTVINLNGGTLTTTGITHITTAQPATINFNGGTFQSLNTLSIPATITLSVKSGGAVFNVSGQLTVAATLADGTGGGGLTKQGAGTLALGSAAHAYTGSTSISAGAITVAKTNGASTATATFGPTTLGVSFNTAPTVGMTFRFFPGSTTQTYASVTLTGAPGRTGSYDSATSTLTIS